MEQMVIQNFKENEDNYHRILILGCLKDVPDNETLRVHLEIGDCVQCCTKKGLFKRAFEGMPYYFYCEWIGLEKDKHGTWQPRFNRVAQAAWNAANEEYMKEKGELCAKWGCE